MLARFERVVEHNLSFEWNRLLHRGDKFVSTQARTVLNDASDGFLSGLLFGHLGLVALGGELRGEGLLTVLTFLDNLGFSRCKVRVLTNLGRERDRNRPGDILRAFGRLRAYPNNLIDRFFSALPRAVLLLLFLARLAFGVYLVLTGRQRVVVLVLDLERNFTRWDVDNLDHGCGGVLRVVFVGHGDWNCDFVSGLRILRRGRGDLTLVVNRDGPTCRNIAHRERVLLGNADAFRFVNGDRQLHSISRVHRFRGV